MSGLGLEVIASGRPGGLRPPGRFCKMFDDAGVVYPLNGGAQKNAQMSRLN